MCMMHGSRVVAFVPLYFLTTMIYYFLQWAGTVRVVSAVNEPRPCSIKWWRHPRTRPLHRQMILQKMVTNQSSTTKIRQRTILSQPVVAIRNQPNRLALLANPKVSLNYEVALRDMSRHFHKEAFGKARIICLIGTLISHGYSRSDTWRIHHTRSHLCLHLPTTA